MVTGVYGTPLTQDDIYIEGAPYIYFQEYGGPDMVDADNYYYGLSGTVTHPIYQIGCIQDVSFGENVTMNAVRCDTSGDKDVIQKRNHLEVNLTITTLLPLSQLAHILKFSLAKASGSTEKVGIGNINNNRKYKIYMPKVYDEDTGDFVAIQLHKCKFVDAFTINFRQGEPWNVTGLKLWGLRDDVKPSGQEFATIIRADADALP